MKKLILISLFVPAILLGCSSTDGDVERIPEKSPAALYEDAKQSMDLKNYSTASRTLEALVARYPFGPHAQQANLDLIYCYYKSNQNAQALANIDRFVRLNPTHPDLDWVLYIRGLTNTSASGEAFHDFFSMDRSDRDPTSVQEAFTDFQRLIRDYPDSEYAGDAKLRMIELKTKLAKHELAVARYYMERKAYVAASKRASFVVEHFQDTLQTEEALEIMIAAYEKLGLTSLQQQAQQTLALNFPDNTLGRP